MSKKTIFTFLLGAVASGLVFGLIAFFSSKPSAEPEISKPLAQLEIIEKPQPVKMIPEANAMMVETPAFKAILSSAPDPHSVTYEVRPGDNLTSISKKHGSTVELIKKINLLSTDRLLPGMKLKIPTYRFSVVVDKSQNSLILKGDEEVLKTYVVSTGENNSTPVGVFKITDRLVNPTWYKAGAVVPHGSPENVLGTRWLGFNKQGYGIHGTTEPEKLGQQVTAGCVRMRNEEVEDLFAFMISGAEVTIVD